MKRGNLHGSPAAFTPMTEKELCMQAEVGQASISVIRKDHHANTRLHMADNIVKQEGNRVLWANS